MKKLIALAIILLVAVLMTLTRPDKKAHKEAMMEAVKEYIDEEAGNKGFADNGLTRLGKGAIVKTIGVVISTKLKMNDYYLFNTTHAKIGGQDRILSVGVLGHVFTFDKDMLREAIEKED